MKTLSLWLGLSVILIATSGCETRRMYSGPRQPSKAVAQIKPGPHLRVQALDSQGVPKSSQRNTWLQMLPGERQVDITSFDEDYRVVKESNSVDIVRRVFLTPESAATIKFTAVAGAKYEVQYYRQKDDATYTLIDKKTGAIAGAVSTTLRAIAVPEYYYGPPVHFYIGSPFWGPPGGPHGPVFHGPRPGPMPPPR